MEIQTSFYLQNWINFLRAQNLNPSFEKNKEGKINKIHLDTNLNIEQVENLLLKNESGQHWFVREHTPVVQRFYQRVKGRSGLVLVNKKYQDQNNWKKRNWEKNMINNTLFVDI